MNDTKEMILLIALRLFAQNGYEAVFVSMMQKAILIYLQWAISRQWKQAAVNILIL